MNKPEGIKNEAPTRKLVGIKRNSSEAEYPPSLPLGATEGLFSPPSSDQQVGRYSAKENKNESMPSVSEALIEEPSEKRIWELAQRAQEEINYSQDSTAELIFDQQEELKKLFELAVSLNIPKETVEQILARDKVSQNLSGIKKAAHRLLKKIKRSILVGLGASIFLVPNIGTLGKGKHALDIFETSPIKRNVGIISVNTIRASVLEDKKEWSFMGTNLDGEDYSTPTEGHQAQVETDVESFIKIQMARPEVTEIRFAHTHPLTCYQFLRTLGDRDLKPVEYSFEEIEKFKQGKLNLPPLPPSSPDIQMTMVNSLEQREKDLHFRHQVFEPSGKWEFTIDKEHRFVKEAKRLIQEQKEMLRQFLSSITETEREKIIELEGGFRPNAEDLISTMETNRISLSKVKKFKKLFEQMNKEILSLQEKFALIEMKAHALRTARGSSSEKIKELINNYIGACQEIGVNMNYLANK